ncbi:MAG: PTS sugar transporter subunit IIA [Candidatus Kapaibacterium sp.]|jgi:fructose-specific phosphotransferase system IIA component|nr:PTS sugar transporter subunit IIA [Candidatus Kapabacteria bacterium]
MKINEILSANSVRIAYQTDSKESLLSELVTIIGKEEGIDDLSIALKDVFEREEVMSTGVGKGIALPHAKSKAVNKSVAALAILKEPIDFDSLDNEPVNIAFLLLGPENNVGLHLRLLSKVSRLMNNDSFRLQLIECKKVEDVMKLFDSMEEI